MPDGSRPAQHGCQVQVQMRRRPSSAIAWSLMDPEHVRNCVPEERLQAGQAVGQHLQELARQPAARAGQIGDMQIPHRPARQAPRLRADHSSMTLAVPAAPSEENDVLWSGLCKITPCRRSGSACEWLGIDSTS